MQQLAKLIARSCKTACRKTLQPFIEKAMSLTPESGNEIASESILPDHLACVVVGDMNKVEQGILELNLGEIHKIDADGNPI